MSISMQYYMHVQCRSGCMYLLVATDNRLLHNNRVIRDVHMYLTALIEIRIGPSTYMPRQIVDYENVISPSNPYH